MKPGEIAGIVFVGAAAGAAALGADSWVTSHRDGVRRVALERMEDPYGEVDARISLSYAAPKRVPVEWRERIADCADARAAGGWAGHLREYRALEAGLDQSPELPENRQNAILTGGLDFASGVDHAILNCVWDIVPVGEARQW